MPTLKLFLKARTDKVPDDVLHSAGMKLREYFVSIYRKQSPGSSPDVLFKVNPSPGEIGEKDLLVYITEGNSYIIHELDRLDPGPAHELPPGHNGGGTKKMPNGEVLSEVPWTGGLAFSGVGRAQALANLIFHEWVHNKYANDARALGMGEVNGAYVHTQCGGGVLAAELSYFTAARSTINEDNRAAMLRVIDRANKQYTAGLT